jgi:short-subunit dehydrogenase
MELSGTTALVTGANGGIGRAMTELLAEHCDTVLAGVRIPADVTFAAENIRVIELDLASRESIDRCFEAERTALEAVDVLVNNAGVLSVGLLEEQDPLKIEQSVQVNLTSLILLTQLILPSMIARGRGIVVNNASMSGYAWFPLASVYAASKAGVVAFSEALRRELEPTGVKVIHLVTPGVETPMLEATESGYGDHFDTSEWDKVTPEEWAAEMIRGITNDDSVVWPGGKTRLAALAGRGPSFLLDRAAGRMFRR